MPTVEKEHGLSLMQALDKRQSTRRFSDTALSQQEVSNLLWAAWGINRDSGKRTVPTAHNKQAVAVYAAMDTGIWFYDAKKHTLERVSDKNLQERFKAPLTLIYAAPADDKFNDMHVGSIYQNVGLYCASAGLANVVKHSGVDLANEQLAGIVPKGYVVRIIQLVGLPS